MRLIPKESVHSWTAYLWLIYLSFFLAAPAMNPHTSAAEWMATAAGTLAFLALYFRGFWVRGRALLLCMAGITALGVIFTPFNPGAGAFFIYAAAFAGSLGSTRQAWWSIAAIEAVTIATLLLAKVSVYNAIWPVVFVVIVGAINTHYAEQGRANKRLRLAHDEIERLAKVAERERIARDLHDLLGHTLSLIVLKSELATKIAERDPARAAREIADVERISRDALAQVRQAVSGYRNQGLSSEIASAREMLRAANVELTVDAQPAVLSAAQEAILSLALREGVTNVVRHAQATRCSISISGAEQCVRMTIRDDGRGGGPEEGAGLAGMRERVAAVGGTLSRETSGGTTLTIVLPSSAALECSA